MSYFQAPDDRAKFARRRVIAASLIVIIVALLVGVTVIVVKLAAPSFEASSLAAVTASPQPAGAAAPVQSPASTTAPTPSLAPAPPTTPPAPVGFDTHAFSIDDPDSLWVVVNKLRPITDAADFTPPNIEPIPDGMHNPFGQSLRVDTVDALQTMFDAAHSEVGTTLTASSGYRTYASQTRAYNGYVASIGVDGADKTSARPGFSEHQTGLAVDILDTTSGCTTDYPCFGNTPSGQWLAANAYRFGFILRYPGDKTAVTGYEYEPWHFRYVGIPLATEMHTQHIETLEEFFGLPPAPTYAP